MNDANLIVVFVFFVMVSIVVVDVVFKCTTWLVDNFYL